MTKRKKKFYTLIYVDDDSIKDIHSGEYTINNLRENVISLANESLDYMSSESSFDESRSYYHTFPKNNVMLGLDDRIKLIQTLKKVKNKPRDVMKKYLSRVNMKRKGVPVTFDDAFIDDYIGGKCGESLSFYLEYIIFICEAMVGTGCSQFGFYNYVDEECIVSDERYDDFLTNPHNYALVLSEYRAYDEVELMRINECGSDPYSVTRVFCDEEESVENKRNNDNVMYDDESTNDELKQKLFYTLVLLDDDDVVDLEKGYETEENIRNEILKDADESISQMIEYSKYDRLDECYHKFFENNIIWGYKEPDKLIETLSIRRHQPIQVVERYLDEIKESRNGIPITFDLKFVEECIDEQHNESSMRKVAHLPSIETICEALLGTSCSEFGFYDSVTNEVFLPEDFYELIRANPRNYAFVISRYYNTIV